MPPTRLIDPALLDTNRVIASVEEIRRRNPHRGHMEHLTAIIYIDPEQHLIAGYKDVRHDEFWVAGHVPGYPIFPGVIQIEAAAQLVCFYASYRGILNNSLMGLGGVDNARFRAAVRPGDRLVIEGKGKRVDRRQTVFHLQGYVESAMAFECDIIGVPIPGWERTEASREQALHGAPPVYTGGS